MILFICAVIWFLSRLLWRLTLCCPFLVVGAPKNVGILPLSSSGSAVAGKRQPHFNARADLVKGVILFNEPDSTAERKALFIMTFWS